MYKTRSKREAPRFSCLEEEEAHALDSWPVEEGKAKALLILDI